MENIDKIYTPATIEDTPFPQEGLADLTTAQSAVGSSGEKTYPPESIHDTSFPTRKVAVDLIGPALNTRSKKIIQEFQFTVSGALQIGEYKEGISGDIRISPNGIVGRDSTGQTTFAIDGETGDAVFTGTFQARSVISGNIVVGNSDIIIDGENRRMVFYEGSRAVIVIGEL